MKDWSEIESEQKEICRKLNELWQPLNENLMVAINGSLFTKLQPINGLRHPSHGSMNGWYLWSGGEIDKDDTEFFKPIHPEHLISKKSIVLKYLGLPPGWRFQIDENGYEDLWFDESLLKI